MPSSPFSFGQILALVLVVLVAAWLIRRAGANLRAELREKRRAGPALTKEQLEAITAQGLATPEQLFAMSPKEQQLLAATALAMRGGQSQRRTREQ